MRSKRVLVLTMMLVLSFVLVACQTTTVPVTTVAPTTSPTTITTQAPTTVAPTTVAPTTVAPTTVAPTTVAPTTVAPTTVAPTTVAPTTVTTTTALPTTLSLMSGWVDGPDGVHTITASAGILSVIYNKNSFAWASMSKEITQDLSRFNKLVFTVSGSGTLMIKIQGETQAVEVQIQLTPGAVTYQLNLRDDDLFLAGVSQVLVFGGPGKAVGEGNITFTKFEFDEGTAFGNVLEKGDNNIPQNQLIYDGVGNTFDFATGLTDNGDGVYVINNTGPTVLVSYNKSGFEWSFMRSVIQGNFSNFDYVVLEITSSSNIEVILKAELNPAVQSEKKVMLVAGVKTTVTLDLTAWTNEHLNALTQILVFAAGGNTTAVGQLEIHRAYFSKVFVGQPDPEPETNVWSGKGTQFSSNLLWQSNSGDVFVVTYEGNVANVDYNKTTNHAWATIKYPVSGDFSKFDKIVLEVTGVAGHKLLVKINPTHEMWVDLTGSKQTIEFSLVNIPDAVLAVLDFVYLFPAANNDVPVSGTLVIHSTSFQYQRLTYTPADPVVNFDINSGWFDDSNELFSILKGDSTYSFTYSRTSGALAWANVRTQIQGPFSDFNYLIAVVTGVAGKQILVKIEGTNGNAEKWVTLTGDEQVIVFDLTSYSDALLDGLKMVLIFPEGGVSVASGMFTVHELYFALTAPETVVLENSFDGKGNGINTNLYWDKTGPGDPFVV
ncbi:MAG: hypothetical protein U1C51_08865, partial [Candidatus Izemoplasmatales bacterium]|nr:hypothetical protein [Candidatus Izemoplasmatales bacterium]